MTPKLAIRIHKYLEGESLDNGAVAEVRALSDSGLSRPLKRVAIPVNDNASREKIVDVSPGRYLVSATLPSGEVLSQAVNVSGDETVNVTLDAGDSPHEWLSWQQWSGNVAGRVSTHALQANLTTSSERVRRTLDDVTASLRRPTTPPPNAESDPVWAALSQHLGNLGENASIDVNKVIPADYHGEAVNVLSDPPYLSAQLPLGTNLAPGRAYLTASKKDKSVLCAVPWPWYQVDGSGEARVEAVIAIDEEVIEQKDFDSSVRDDACLWSVRPTVRDRTMGGLLAYFAAGEGVIARELLEPARQLLFEKQLNPFGAAAGAYILVNDWIHKSSSGTTRDWMGWIENLSHWFPWLPDGAILHGWLALRSRDQAPRADLARKWLLEAERRGIPVFTMGVKKLVDGLLLLSGEYKRQNKSDPEIEQALARARRLAWQIDPRQPFTCVRLFAT